MWSKGVIYHSHLNWQCSMAGSRLLHMRIGYTWCQQLPKFADKPGHWSFAPPFLSPASSAFLPHSEQLSRKEMSKKACRLERAPCGPAASPTTLTCMLSCIRAWPAFIGVSLEQASPIRDMPGQGGCRSLNQ